MKNGILLINHYLKTDKFNELYEWLKKSAYDLNINLSVKTNREIMIDTEKKSLSREKIDFILFWDKDILLAKYLEQQGFRVFNSANSIEMCDDKALTHVMLSNKDIPMPKTIIPPFSYANIFEALTSEDDVFDNYVLKEVIDEIGFPMIIKAKKGSFGANVHLILNKNELFAILKTYNSNDVIFQEYIESSKGRDVRINVVGDKVVTSMYRYSNDDFRANISNGGKMKEYEPSDKMKELAIKATSILGLDFAGVDILFNDDDFLVCEVNSNAHFINIYNCTGINVADYIFKHILECIK